MKIFTIVGARPSFIKIDPEIPNQVIVHTGQHYDYKMSKVFFQGMKLPTPEYNLKCTEIGKMIDKLLQLLSKEKPDLVIVIGDTNSALAGALAASMANIKVAHIEAGLRSYDMTMPEEKNRVLIDRISYLLFCPNNAAALNLMKEGTKENVFVVGDPLFDSMGRFMPIPKSRNYQKYNLLTTHRNFNVDNPERLQSVLDAIGESGVQTIFPVHPRTRKMLKNIVKLPENLVFKPPQGYKQMLALISNAKKVITDSGGVQREAYWMNVPVIILRENTEWNEIVGRRGGILVGTDKARILDAILNFRGAVNSPPEANVNKRIREILYKFV